MDASLKLSSMAYTLQNGGPGALQRNRSFLETSENKVS